MTKNSDIYNVTFDTPKTKFVTKTDSIVESFIDEHIKRAQMGEKKYNTTLDRTDLSVLDYLQHAKEEAMDLTLYLEKAIQIIKNNG